MHRLDLVTSCIEQAEHPQEPIFLLIIVVVSGIGLALVFDALRRKGL